ncbi:hypothetical protein K431DRAFT_214020 [Polychaeton citri CBS 116435]|uniref:PAN2-PAN3 deadenylation complex subunit PAN3 n=1 Tax=Polychaeton citri CBS 116435 TaxID=1314669 RepID=A0A9P4QHV6_9PEZI|nr:hypothetical protein K431DRAFT_214020 [Polychaeton citri CBS 116435]
MAAQPRVSGDARRYHSGSRFGENRPPTYTILCRNGPNCRKRQEGTCNYSHDHGQLRASNGLTVPKTAKSLNVESPSFTPKTTAAQPAQPQTQKALGISPKAAAAATFTPRGSGSQIDAQLSSQLGTFGGDLFVTSAGLQGFDASQQTSINPYATAQSAVGGQTYFPDTGSFKHPLNYHLYASIAPYRANLMSYQRSASDFFIPDDLRQDLQQKSEATLQTFANSMLPNVEHFHSLVALDTSNQRGPSTFGYPSHLYKATSSKDGNHYVLRRIEGFRLTDAEAINSCKAWKRISCGNVVLVYDAFTTREFGDSSLIVVSDYHPLSQTLAEKHFAPTRLASRSAGQIVPENDLWGYIVQLANALKAIHSNGLAAQTVQASKILLTSKNRIRLNGCGILDVTQFDSQKPIAELQQSDLLHVGQVILAIAVRNPTAHNNVSKSLELVSRTYTERLRACLAWLLSPPTIAQDTATDAESQTPHDYSITAFLTNISDKVMATFDGALHQADESTSNLMRELENGRLVRLLAKLNVILERPETSPTSAGGPASNSSQPSSTWSETGERYYLKLFRDFVFHQVDHDGRPVLDLGHMITCLNKLDAGIDEKIQLVSRNEQDVFIMSYRDIKRGLEAAWTEIVKASNPARR